MPESEHKPSISPDQDIDVEAVEAAHRQVGETPATGADVNEQERELQEQMRDTYIARVEKAAPEGGDISVIAQNHAVGFDQTAASLGGERKIYGLEEGHQEVSK